MLPQEYQNTVQGLDPTQKLTVDVIAEWVENRKVWTNAYIFSCSAKRSVPRPPKLQLLLLGTAGTGQTHTAKVAMTSVRIALE